MKILDLVDFRTSHLVTGCFGGGDDLLLITNIENEDEVVTSELVRLVDFDQATRLAALPWQAVDIAVSPLDDSIWIAGRDGDYAIVRGEEVEVGRVSQSRSPGPIRGITAVGETMLIFGMKREVYGWNLSSGSDWTELDQGMRRKMPGPGSGLSFAQAKKLRRGPPGGITAIIGPELEGAHAFGFGGEIWRFSDAMWHRLDSPTNVILRDAKRVGPDRIMACGQYGHLIEGQGDNWRLIDLYGADDVEFCALAQFQSEVYLGDGASLRRLDGGSLVMLDLGTAAFPPSSSLFANDNLLVSVAGRELFVTRDGMSWQDVLDLRDESL